MKRIIKRIRTPNAASAASPARRTTNTTMAATTAAAATGDSPGCSNTAT